VLLHNVENAKLEPPIPNFLGTVYTQKVLKERGIVENVELIPGCRVARQVHQDEFPERVREADASWPESPGHCEHTLSHP